MDRGIAKKVGHSSYAPDEARRAGAPASVRIIAGRLRGRKLAQVPHEGVRPTPDRVREALFNILGQNLAGMAVLDLFTGTGAVGLEAASRGAQRVVLVDQDEQACETCRQNVRMLQEAQKVTVMRAEALQALQRLGGEGRTFDVVFADPPYAQSLESLQQLVERVEGTGVLAADGTFVLQMKRGRPAPQTRALEAERPRHYGITSIWIYERPT